MKDLELDIKCLELAVKDFELLLKNGDLVIITKGDLIGVHGRTNSMKIVTVGDV